MIEGLNENTCCLIPSPRLLVPVQRERQRRGHLLRESPRQTGIYLRTKSHKSSPKIWSLVKQEGRILCLAWHESGNFIATGSPDTIRIWNVESGHPIARMTTGRDDKNRQENVMSLENKKIQKYHVTLCSNHMVSLFYPRGLVMFSLALAGRQSFGQWI